MKILGPSLDGKYLFTSKGFYVCEQKKFVKYSVNMIPEILKVAKDTAKYQYRNGLISLTEYKLKPKKVIKIDLSYLFLESFLILNFMQTEFIMVTHNIKSEFSFI